MLRRRVPEPPEKNCWRAEAAPKSPEADPYPGNGRSLLPTPQKGRPSSAPVRPRHSLAPESERPPRWGPEWSPPSAPLPAPRSCRSPGERKCSPADCWRYERCETPASYRHSPPGCRKRPPGENRQRKRSHRRFPRDEPAPWKERWRSRSLPPGPERPARRAAGPVPAAGLPTIFRALP